MDYKTIVRDNIKGFRHKLNWTQEKLSVRTKLSNDYISRLELGKEGISLETLLTFAKAFKIEPYLLLIKDSYK
jgi:transcriptional regulator with XRE-family HTH domain